MHPHDPAIRGTEKLKPSTDFETIYPADELFTVRPASTWMVQANQRPVPRMLFGKLWYEGELCILFADSNLGKSILAVQIGNCINTGIALEPFSIEGKKQPVLYCDFELTDKQFEARYSDNFANHYPFNPDFYRAELNPDNDVPAGFSDFDQYTPKEFFKANPGFINYNAIAKVQPVIRAYSVLPFSLVEASMKSRNNNFLYFLRQMLGNDVADELAAKYYIGSSKHWPGAVVFWQIDGQGKVRTGKVMLYDKTSCKRVKMPYNHIAWAHVLVGRGAGNGAPGASNPTTGYSLKQCFFGEHLLQSDPWKTVAICESEKTAILGSYFMPRYIWLAAGSLEGLSTDKCRVLKNRTVTLFPDVNAYEKWREKAQLLNVYIPSARFTVDSTLEHTATPNERTHGIDLADRWLTQTLKQ